MSEKLPDNSEQNAPGESEEELSEDDLTNIELDEVSGGRVPPKFIQMPTEFLQRINPNPQWIQRV